MNRRSENNRFRRFRETRDPRHLAKVFDSTAPELLRVASHLGNGDREIVQDALQATYLTAIEDADRWDDSRDVRPWLLGILANHVRKERRKTRKHRGNDPDAAALAAKESPVGEAVRAEFSSAAIAAMQELPSPFREAIVLHLQHGLNAKEIGEALGRPAGTVRTQIVRGLERLRQLLPAGFAAGFAMTTVVASPAKILAAVREQVLSSLPAVVGSSSLFLTHWRLFAMTATAAATLVAILIPFFAGDDPAPPSPSTATSNLAANPERATVDGDTRELVAHAAPRTPEPEEPRLTNPPQGNGIPVEFEVVYERDGKPAIAVPVMVRVKGRIRRALTDGAGKVVLDLPWPGYHESYVLGTSAHHLISWPDFVARPTGTQNAKLVIPKGMNLEVEVVDPKGNPVAGAVVESSHGRQFDTMLTALGRTDTAGRIVRRDVGNSGQMRAWAPGFLPSGIYQADGKVDDTRRVRIELRPGGHRATGIVRDVEGEPVPHVELALVQLRGRPLEPQKLMSDENGKFSIASLHAGNHVLVGSKGERDDRLCGQLRFSHDGASMPNLELRLTSGASIRGRLTNMQGRPLANQNLVARDRPEAVHRLPFLETWTRSRPDGTFEIRGLVPGRYELECDHCDSHEIEVRDGEVATWNPVRSALLPVAMRLLDAAGKPLAGWRISIIPPGTEYTRGGTSTGDDGRLLHATGSTWQHPPGSHYRLAVYPRLGKHEKAWDDVPRWPCLVTPPLAIGVEHEIRVPDHSRSIHHVSGRLVDHEGQPIAEGRVFFYGPLGSPYQTSIYTDADGSFRFEDVPPARYRGFVRMKGRPTLSLPALDVRGPTALSYGDVRVPRTGQVVVDIDAGEANGTLSRVRLELVRPNGSTLRLKRMDDGSWRSPTVYRGSYRVRGFAAGGWFAPTAVELDAAERRVTAHFARRTATRLTIELAPSMPRNASSWSGTLTATTAAGNKIQHRLERSFFGNYQSKMEFDLTLPPGQLTLNVRSWNRHRGAAEVQVPTGGGGAARIVIE
ncbi:MAG: sigma-70 family RNA polymerase sigma factor [bacterium]|nr:sigma-70 family RNA polymerase sigma factor [bacterium]